MESEVRRLVSLIEQHEQQLTTLNADHSRRLQEERTRWESKQVVLFTLAFLLKLVFVLTTHALRDELPDQQTLIKGFWIILSFRLAEQTSALKRERDLRDEALTRLSLDLEQSQRNEAVLKNEIHIKTNLLDSSRQDFQRQISMNNLDANGHEIKPPQS